MTESTGEWVKKAEGDYRTMSREFKVTRQPNHSAVCFHAQQCVEKLLKGFLNEHDIRFAKTHDLLRIITLTYPVRPEWKALELEADSLTDYASESRYPGEDCTFEEARYAVEVCKKIRKVVLAAIKSSEQLPLT
jgi:HEPN domain-containing protein